MNLFQERTYRTQFNSERFTGFEISYLETDLWIGVDSDSFNLEMKELALDKIKSLRKQFDEYIKSEPFFKKSLKPFHPSGFAPSEAVEMAVAAEKAGIGPMSAVAGLFAREIGEEIIQNFSVNELVVENGGDIYVLLKDELIRRLCKLQYHPLLLIWLFHPKKTNLEFVLRLEQLAHR